MLNVSSSNRSTTHVEVGAMPLAFDDATARRGHGNEQEWARGGGGYGVRGMVDSVDAT
jgi:hypothetical protein